jgi:hypothetical protein
MLSNAHACFFRQLLPNPLFSTTSGKRRTTYFLVSAWLWIAFGLWTKPQTTQNKNKPNPNATVITAKPHTKVLDGKMGE